LYLTQHNGGVIDFAG